MKRFFKTIAIILLVILLILSVGPFLVPVPPLPGTVPPEQLADPDSLFVEVNGLTVHYKQIGQGQPAIILMHGFGASTYSWREVMEPLSQYGQVIAFDRPAFGLTERPLPGEWRGGQNPYSPEAQVTLLFGLMETLGIDRAVLVGNSAGGTIAVNAALERPERVQALVLVDAAVYAGGGSPGWIRPLFQLPQVNHLAPLAARASEESAIRFLESAWHDRSLLTPEIVEGYRKPLRAQNWDVAIWELIKTSRASNAWGRLDALTMPVLVVTGDNDTIVPTDDSVRLAKEIPGAELVVFENCGHLPQEECPQAFMEAVEGFLQHHAQE